MLHSLDRSTRKGAYHTSYTIHSSALSVSHFKLGLLVAWAALTDASIYMNAPAHFLFDAMPCRAIPDSGVNRRGILLCVDLDLDLVETPVAGINCLSTT